MVGQLLKYLLSCNSTADDNPAFEILEIMGCELTSQKTIYPNVLPQNYGTPAIVYTITGNEPSKVKETKAIATTIEFELDIVAENYSVVNSLVNLIIPYLHRYKNTYNSANQTNIGFGMPPTSFGKFGPASTGPIQYVAGFQIIDCFFISSVENFDAKLELFRNTLNFKLTYIKDITQFEPEFILKLDDLNLMSTIVNSTDNPLYTQPIAINQSVNAIFCPNLFPTINDTLDGTFPLFLDTSGTSGTNRPLLIKSVLNPPKYNELNALKFEAGKFLTGNSFLQTRKLKEYTFFAVFNLTDSKSQTQGAAFLHAQISNSVATTIYASTENSGGVGGFSYYRIKGTVMNSTSYEGFEIMSVASWPLLGINTDASFDDPVFIAFSLEKSNDSLIMGEFKMIMSSYPTSIQNLGDTGINQTWTRAVANGFDSEHLFVYDTIHTDIPSFDPKFGNTTPLNDEITIYDMVLFNEKIDFGTSKFEYIKRNIIEKHGMLNLVE